MTYTKTLVSTCLSFAMVCTAGASDFQALDDEIKARTLKMQNAISDFSSPEMSSKLDEMDENQKNRMKEELLLILSGFNDPIAKARDTLAKNIQRYNELDARINVVINSHREMLAEAAEIGLPLKPAGK